MIEIELDAPEADAVDIDELLFSITGLLASSTPVQEYNAMMSSSPANPSLDPADNNTLAGSISFAFKKLMQNINGMLPAQVIKYDRETNRVQVKLLITMLTTDGQQVSRSQIASLPVLRLGGGTFVMSFPLKEGDLGWVLASDRDISLFLQSYSEARPNTVRMFSFSDGLFVPDEMKNVTIDGDDEDNLVIQNDAGSVKIALGAASINIKAPVINIEAVTTNLTGNLAVVGNITATGTITPGTP